MYTCHCVAVNCFVKSGQGYRMFSFPQDEKRRRIWAVNAGLGENYKPKYRARICIKHFESNQLDIGYRMASSLGFYHGGRLLKNDAIPTIFGHSLEEENEVDVQDKQQESIPKRRKLANRDSASACTEAAQNTDSDDEPDSTERQTCLQYELAGTNKRKTTSVYICALPKRSATHVPDNAEMEYLSRNGLGGRILQFPKHGKANEVTQKILSAFPKLKDGFLDRFEVWSTSQTGNNRLCFLSDSYSCTVGDLLSSKGLICVKPVDSDIDVEQIYTRNAIIVKDVDAEDEIRGIAPDSVYFNPVFIKAETIRYRSLQKFQRETGHMKNDDCLLKFSRKLKFLENMSKYFYNMQQEGTFCNVRLKGSDGSVFAHRLVLMTSESPLLQSIFQDSKTWSQQCLNLDFSSFSYKVLDALIKYIYTGVIQIVKKDATYLFRLFKWLKLNEACDVLKPFCLFSFAQPNLVNMLQQVVGKSNDDSVSDIPHSESNRDEASNSSALDQTNDSYKGITSPMLHGICNTDEDPNSAMMLGVSNSDVIPISIAILQQEISNTDKTPSSASPYKIKYMNENSCSSRMSTANQSQTYPVQNEMRMFNKSTIPDAPHEMINVGESTILYVETRNTNDSTISAESDEMSNVNCGTISSAIMSKTNAVPFEISNVNKLSPLSIEMKNTDECRSSAVPQEISNVDNWTISFAVTENTNGITSSAVPHVMSYVKEGSLLSANISNTDESTSVAVPHEISDVNKGTILSAVMLNSDESSNSAVKHEISEIFEGEVLPVEMSNTDQSTSSAVTLERSHSNEGTILTDETQHLIVKLEAPDIPTLQSEKSGNMRQKNQELKEESRNCFPVMSRRCSVNNFSFDHIYSKSTCQETFTRTSNDVEAEVVFPEKIIFENTHFHGKAHAYNETVKTADQKVGMSSENCESKCYSDTSVEGNTLCNATLKSEPMHDIVPDITTKEIEQETRDISCFTKLKPNFIHVFDNERESNFVIKTEVHDDYICGETNTCSDRDTLLQTENNAALKISKDMDIDESLKLSQQVVELNNLNNVSIKKEHAWDCQNSSLQLETESYAGYGQTYKRISGNKRFTHDT